MKIWNRFEMLHKINLYFLFLLQIILGHQTWIQHYKLVICSPEQPIINKS